MASQRNVCVLLRRGNPSALLLAVAEETRRGAQVAGLRVSDYAADLSASQLALIAVGSAARRVSPFSMARDQEIATLRAADSLREEVLPAVLASPAAAGWGDELARERQTWINLSGGPPGPSLFAKELTLFPALATKPLGGLWTSTALPDLASVWLTREPADWATLPAAATVWNVRPSASRPVRCYEIGSREDWVALCETFPEDSTQFYEQHLATSELHWRSPFVTPRWSAVQAEFDAVHLKWSGFLDGSYEVVPVLNGTTALCGWGSEGTLWLRWMFDEWSELGSGEQRKEPAHRSGSGEQ